ncbi:ABC transporter permease [Williamsia sterculiae]|uniref:Peptide/nickel transport system permease protein n=1 Tax=Williamsia sterculiae TaxID=1344003 RepID=A0A1N7D1D1_9NOCA|nr:ABC transporter permease [Williamsia sterculiae]SIR69577.1 peptide/nickel transport system permease protein [Williamsia sterculiae]
MTASQVETLALTPPPSPVGAGLRTAVTDLTRKPVLIIAWVVVLTAIGWAVVPGLFTHYSPFDGNPDASFLAPYAQHWFGTDRLGRDMFARSVFGARTTLASTLLAVLIAFGVGTLLGLVAGFARGVVDTVIMRCVDVFLAIPSLLLAMVVVSVLGYSTYNVALAVGISSIASFARVMRAEVMTVASRDYVQAAYGLGVRRLAVVVKHVVPNSLNSVLALAAVEVGTAILAVASLGFLGYGAPPPQPEWGLLVSEGRDYVASSWWVSILPGASLAIVVIATHRISVSFRKARVS